MNLTKKITAILLTLVMVFAFSSCLGQEEATAEIDIGTVNIGVIYSGDIEEDGSLSQKHHNSFNSARDSAGAGESQINERDNVPVGDKEALQKTMEDLVSRGCRLVVTTDEGYYNDIFEYAGKNPSIYFVALADYHETVKEADNFATLNLRTFEADYIEGMVAAANSKTGKIAFVADSEDTTAITAFATGAKAVDPDSVVIFAESTDVKAGIDKALATDKCDVVYSKNYVVNEEEEGTMFFDVPNSLSNDMCVNVLGEENKFVSGANITLDRVYTKIITDTVNEKFDDIKSYSAGIAEGSVDVRPVEDTALQAKIDAIENKLYKGEKLLDVEAVFAASSVPYIVAK